MPIRWHSAACLSALVFFQGSCPPHHEEREEQKQFQHLETGEFTVMPFLNSNAGEIEVQAGDCTDYTINGPVTIIF